ncbi:hypothetical protein ARMGADRAFT_1165370 [Armillaria gallica]|uniref:Uncharacterized protein n=1 Tax=Armillaria gallica TaxID=47427 RepID=A0A2H3DG80_ARMGA|nr:hypothetical protein ARMGADRAFT_1165370 [Armillaria gallica]
MTSSRALLGDGCHLLYRAIDKDPEEDHYGRDVFGDNGTGRLILPLLTVSASELEQRDLRCCEDGTEDKFGGKKGVFCSVEPLTLVADIRATGVYSFSRFPWRRVARTLCRHPVWTHESWQPQNSLEAIILLNLPRLIATFKLGFEYLGIRRYMMSVISEAQS